MARQAQLSIQIKRAYDLIEKEDGYRVLVDRLWPRGLRKENAGIDAWPREIAPSSELRRWYGHDPDKWTEFQKRYRRELGEPEAEKVLQELAERAERQPLTLLSASRALEISDAAVVREVLNEHARRSRGRN